MPPAGISRKKKASGGPLLKNRGKNGAKLFNKVFLGRARSYLVIINQINSELKPI